MPTVYLRVYWAWYAASLPSHVQAILFSAVFAGYESVLGIVHRQTITHLGAVAAAAVAGFLLLRRPA
jgi:hypothetical protein